MKTKIKKTAKMITFLAICLFSFIFTAKADHFAAGEATFVRKQNGNFVVTIRIYEDCSGFTHFGAIPSVTITSSQGSLTPLNVNITNSNIISAVDITPLCDNQVSNCGTSSGGVNYGMIEIVYQSTEFSLNSINPGEDYVINVCGSSANYPKITNGNYLQDFDDLYVNTKFKIQTNSGEIIANTVTPSFPERSVLYVCNNKEVSFNLGLGTTDSEGDSYNYSLIIPKGAYFTPN